MNTRPDAPEEPVIARDATYYRAPEGLRERVRASLAQEAPARARETQWWRWGGMAASFAVAGLLAWNGMLLMAREGVDERLLAEVSTAHIRSLMGEGHLNDVVSTDRHTVKPWFQGKLDFAPNVMDLADSGYPLAGGRLDYLNGRPVAAITYRHRLHVINLFEWPAASAGDRAPEATLRKGYAIVRWSRGNLEYWAITDGAASDLLEFARLYPAQ
jgi:anti-sigma factor RsiW